MLHSWEKLEECMPKCKSDYLWVVRQWEFKKICFLSFSILCIMGVYYMYNKNEIKIFILQKIYIAKLPYQIVVSVLFLPISYTHRLGIDLLASLVKGNIKHFERNFDLVYSTIFVSSWLLPQLRRDFNILCRKVLVIGRLPFQTR